MTNLRYRPGAASVTADGSVVTFSSALMLEHAVIGDHISIDRRPSVELVSVDDQTHVGIEPWNGPTLTGVPYVLFQDSLLRSTRGKVATDIAKLNTSLNRSGYYYFVGDDQLEPDPSDGDEGQYAQQESTGKRWRKVEGAWEFVGQFARFSPKGLWNVDSTYVLGDIAKRNGKLWQSLQSPNIGNDPSSSPTFWDIFLENGDVYDVASFDTDRPASAELVARWQAPRPTMFLAGLTDSISSSVIPATATAIFSLRKNDVQFGTLTFAAESAIGVFAAPLDTTFTRGDVFTVIAPDPRDLTLSGTAATFVAFR